MGAAPSQPNSKYVLVPPAFERDLRARSRLAKNSYDYLFTRRTMKWLLRDLLDLSGPSAILYLSPPADEAFSVKAKMALQSTSLVLRFQPLGASAPNAFAEIKAHEGAGVAARGCYFDPSSGWGVFASAPLAGRAPASAAAAGVGFRYSSPIFTAGAILSPAADGTAALSGAWLVGRTRGVTLGAKLQPEQPVSLSGKGALSQGQDVGEWLRRSSCIALAYSPQLREAGGAAGRNPFTACLELVRCRSLVTSFHQHLAVSRRVVNPMEKEDVVGITNYVDVGLQLVSPVGDAPAGDEPAAASGTATGSSSGAGSSASTSKAAAGSEPEAGLNMAVAWQINKNWLVKARVGSASVGASVGLRAWFHPSFFVVASVQYRYRGDGPTGFTSLAGTPVRWGLCVQVENFGAVRYQRGSKDLRGRALLQRHEASGEDLANAEGEGQWVRRSAVQEDYNPAPAEEKTVDYL